MHNTIVFPIETIKQAAPFYIERLKPPYNYCKEKIKCHIVELQIKFGFGVKFQFWGVSGLN